MKEKIVVAIILTLIHLGAGALFIYSLENFYIVVSFLIACFWVMFTGLTLDIAGNQPLELDRWS